MRESDRLKQLLREARQRLEWYVSEDDTNESASNAYWLEGREAAKQTISKIDAALRESVVWEAIKEPVAGTDLHRVRERARLGATLVEVFYDKSWETHWVVRREDKVVEGRGHSWDDAKTRALRAARED